MKLSKENKVKLQEWAQLLYCREHRTQKEIAETIGISERTIGKWKEDFGWEALRKSMLKTKEEQLKDLYAQIEQFNRYIKQKPDGFRFADSKEADALKKITSAIKDLETELNISLIIEVGIEMTKFFREFDYAVAKELADKFDEFIKHKVK